MNNVQRPVAQKMGAAVFLCVGALSFRVAAAVQEPSCDPSCPKGWTCQTEPGPCLDIACDRGSASCPPCPGPDVQVCRPQLCTSDADCDAYMVCAAAPEILCTGQDCVNGTAHYCFPLWHGPCSTAADCGGPGFVCAEQQQCGTSGYDPSAGAPQPDSTTTCEPVGPRVCFPHETICASDADCLDGWTCEDNPLNACWANTADGTTGCTTRPTVCFPPYGRLFGLGAGFAEWATGPGAGSDPPSLALPSLSGETSGRRAGEAGGCAIGGAGTSRSALGWAALAIAALAAVARRRR
jgi:hypothetical protein